MKRTLLILLSVLLIFSLVACGGKEEKVTEEFVDTADAVETGEVTEEEVKEAEAEAEAEEVAAEEAEEAAEEAEEAGEEVAPAEVTGDTPADLVPIDFSNGWEVGKPGGEFVRSTFGSEPKTFNDVIAAETSSTDVTAFLTNGAIERDQFTLEFVSTPGFGKWYEVSEDELTITVGIEEGLLWSDGDDLTAEDIIFSLNQLILREDVGSNSRSGYIIDTDVDGYSAQIPAKAELIDMYTYKLTLPTVYAGIVELGGIPVYPMHVFGPLIGWDKSMGFDFEYETELVNEDGAMYWSLVENKDPAIDYAAVTSFWGLDTDVSEIVSCGPFVIDEYVPGQKIVLAGNPNNSEYDAAGQQLPYLDKATYIFVEDMDTQLARFLAGELDTLGLRGEDYAVFSQEKMDALDATIYDVGPAFGTTFLVFNQNPDIEDEDGNLVPGTVKPEVIYWTTNKEFRLAMAYLIDRQTIINNVAFGFGYPQYSFIPRVSPYYWAGADDAAAKYDPEMAIEILDGLGWVDTDGDGWREDDLGNKIVMELTTNSGNTVREAVGTLFAEEAAAVGVQVQFKPEDFNTMVGKLLSGQNWDGILIGLTGSVDPISGSNVYPSNGNLHMINPNQTAPLTYWEYEVDEAWKIANNTTDEEQRKLGFEIVQRLWIEENPWIFTFNASVMAAYSNKFGNIYHRPLDGFNWKGIMDHMYIK
ncbi:MAG: ABC transporter substrate-binding protein [Bacteroidetes bacterium]|nr:ABC transporter substrate-binding protein [Bacteroidota bacterium]